MRIGNEKACAFVLHIFSQRWNTLSKIKNTTDDLNLRHIMHKRVERALKSVDAVF